MCYLVLNTPQFFAALPICRNPVMACCGNQGVFWLWQNAFWLWQTAHGFSARISVSATMATSQKPLIAQLHPLSMSSGR